MVGATCHCNKHATQNLCAYQMKPWKLMWQQALSRDHGEHALSRAQCHAMRGRNGQSPGIFCSFLLLVLSVWWHCACAHFAPVRCSALSIPRVPCRQRPPPATANSLLLGSGLTIIFDAHLHIYYSVGFLLLCVRHCSLARVNSLYPHFPPVPVFARITWRSFSSSAFSLLAWFCAVSTCQT